MLTPLIREGHVVAGAHAQVAAYLDAAGEIGGLGGGVAVAVAACPGAAFGGDSVYAEVVAGFEPGAEIVNLVVA